MRVRRVLAYIKDTGLGLHCIVYLAFCRLAKHPSYIKMPVPLPQLQQDRVRKTQMLSASLQLQINRETENTIK